MKYLDSMSEWKMLKKVLWKPGKGKSNAFQSWIKYLEQSNEVKQYRAGEKHLDILPA